MDELQAQRICLGVVVAMAIGGLYVLITEGAKEAEPPKKKGASSKLAEDWREFRAYKAEKASKPVEKVKDSA